MKNSVDLTENRDFRYKANSLENNKHIFSLKYFNSVIHYDDSSIRNDKDTGCILQGNYNERLSKKMCSEFGKGNTCDCCGRDLKPYIHDTLCEECNNIHTIHHKLW